MEIRVRRKMLPAHTAQDLFIVWSRIGAKLTWRICSIVRLEHLRQLPLSLIAAHVHLAPVQRDPAHVNPEVPEAIICRFLGQTRDQILPPASVLRVIIVSGDAKNKFEYKRNPFFHARTKNDVFRASEINRFLSSLHLLGKLRFNSSLRRRRVNDVFVVGSDVSHARPRIRGR